MKKTPLERAIAAQTNRKARYEQAQRDAGNMRVCVWVPEHLAPTFRRIAEEARQLQPETGQKLLEIVAIWAAMDGSAE